MNRASKVVHDGLKVFDRNQRIRDLIVQEWALALPPGLRVLDVGAGDCKYAGLFTRCEYIAQDHPDAPYAPGGARLVRSEIASVPLPSASIDAILCTEVLEHVEAPLAAVEEFARLLKPGGRLLISVPLASRVHRVPTHYYGGLGPDFFERALPQRGLRLDRLRPLGCWTEFMAQELGRLPSVIRDSSALHKAIRLPLAVALWPAFRLGLPAFFLALSRFDRSDDLPMGWFAYSTRV